MIEPEKREAIYFLDKEGMPIREISRRLDVNRNTIRSVIEQKGSMPDTTRKDKIVIDEQLLGKLYNDCNGWMQRIHEKLIEEEGINIGYSTLTARIRELGLGKSKKKRCGRVPDEPGAEMQHDTSPYILKIGGKKVKIIGSVIYYRYSKIRYLKFYHSFNRFKMKCFLHEALTFWRFAAGVCIIDNTNLARLRGSGKNAVMIPEMKQFAKQYGFEFICHEINHANRKAGNERSFYTVETNFFPGRTYESLQDLNQQAFNWATVRMPNRAVSKTHLIPAKAFEFEQSHLIKVSPYVAAPYLIHQRVTDQYGYASFEGNFYWVPGTVSSRDNVRLLQYSDHLKIYLNQKLLANYKLPPAEVKNQQFSPPGEPKPLYRPKYRKKPTAQEEKKLRTAAKQINAYLDFALNQNQNPKQKHRFIRQLYWLYQKIILPLFIKTLDRALKYRITDIETIERIASLQLREGNYQLQVTVPVVPMDQDFENREPYLEGRLSDEVDLTIYDQMMEED
jgi:transposase